MAVPDVALAARLVRRDEAALAEIYDAHAAAVFGVLVRLLDHATAQEVLQDVFVRLWDRPEAFDPARAGLRAYLLVMARSRALDRLRGARHRSAARGGRRDVAPAGRSDQPDAAQ